jgi:hypothetical protein
MRRRIRIDSVRPHRLQGTSIGPRCYQMRFSWFWTLIASKKQATMPMLDMKVLIDDIMIDWYRIYHPTLKDSHVNSTAL